MQKQKQAPSAADERKRIANQRRKSRLRNRVKTRNVSDFSSARALEIASRVSISTSVISAPVNLSKRIEQAGAAAAEQAQKDDAIARALASVDAASARGAAAIGMSRAIEQQSGQQTGELKARLSGLAQDVRSTLNAGVGALNERQEAEVAGFERQAAETAAASAAGFNGTANMLNGVRNELTAVAASAAASAASSTKGAAAAAIAAATKALAKLDEITAKMDAAFTALKEAAASGQKAIEAATKIVINSIQEMADAIPGCEGDKKIKMYFCPNHVVYAEKERKDFTTGDNECQFVQELTDGVVTKELISMEGGKVKNYFFNAIVSMDDARDFTQWPSLCCEREFETFEDGWTKAGDASVGKRYTYVEYPERLAYSMADNSKLFSWGEIKFNEVRQKTVNREYIKENRPRLAEKFNAVDDAIAKMYFKSRDNWFKWDKEDANDDDVIRELENLEVAGGEEGCNDYTKLLEGNDVTTIVQLLSNLIQIYVRREIRKSSRMGAAYCA